MSALPFCRNTGRRDAFESASAVLAYARNTLGLKRILGSTTPDNKGLIHVLEKTWVKFEQMVKLSEVVWGCGGVGTSKQ